MKSASRPTTAARTPTTWPVDSRRKSCCHIAQSLQSHEHTNSIFSRTLKNPNVSQEAKDNAKERLDDM